MTLVLTPSLLNMGGNLVEVYTRETQASEQILSDLGVDNSSPVLATVGVAQVPEYVVLQAENIGIHEIKTWSLSRINQTLVIKSLFIDTPSSDHLKFEILSEGVEIFDFYLPRSKTPYEFPAAPLPPSVSIRIDPISAINFLRITLQPASILDTLIPDEDLPTE